MNAFCGLKIFIWHYITYRMHMRKEFFNKNVATTQYRYYAREELFHGIFLLVVWSSMGYNAISVIPMNIITLCLLVYSPLYLGDEFSPLITLSLGISLHSILHFITLVQLRITKSFNVNYIPCYSPWQKRILMRIVKRIIKKYITWRLNIQLVTTRQFQELNDVASIKLWQFLLKHFITSTT